MTSVPGRSRTQQILGAKTKKETVNKALREMVRRWAAVEFGELARGGVFEGLLQAGPVKRASAEPVAANTARLQVEAEQPG